MKEKDPVEFDKLCSELWVVLDERDSLTTVEVKSWPSKCDDRVIPIRLPTLEIEVCLWLKKGHLVNTA